MDITWKYVYTEKVNLNSTYVHTQPTFMTNEENTWQYYIISKPIYLSFNMASDIIRKMEKFMFNLAGCRPIR